MNDRQDVVGALKYLENGLSNIENLNGQWNAINNEINKYKKEIEYEQKRIGTANKNMQTKDERAAKAKSRTKKAGKAATTITVAICAVFLLMFKGCSAVMTAGQDNYAKLTMNVMFMVLLFFCILLVIIVRVIVAGTTESVNNKINRTINKNAAKSLPEAQNNIISHQNYIGNIQQQLPQIESQIAVEYDKIKPLVEAFPPAYCYPYAVQRCAFFIENLRADTLKEALNLYEDEVYKDKMLAEQRKQTTAACISAAANIASAFYAGQTAANTARAADYAGQTAAYAGQAAANTARAAGYAGQAAANTSQSAYYARKMYESLH